MSDSTLAVLEIFTSIVVVIALVNTAFEWMDRCEDQRRRREWEMED